MRTSVFNQAHPVTALTTPVVRSVWPTFLLSAVCALGVSTAANANNPPPNVRSDAPNVYVVKKGDTLWHISKQYLRDAWRWPEIWASNPQVKNPHLIYPKDRLLLCKIAGRSVVGIDAGDGCTGIIRRMGADSNEGRLSPRIRVEPLDVAVSAIPLSEIRAFLTRSRVIDYNTMTTAPYVLAAKGGRVVTAQGDVVYVRGALLQVGDSYGIYREGERYEDPDSKKTLGYEMRQVALGTVIDSNNDVASIRLTESFGQEVRDGDRVLPEEPKSLPPIFYPTNSQGVAPSRLIRVMDSIETAAINSVITINRGAQDGAKVGQVFAVYRRGEVVRDPKLKDLVRMPSERAGMAMVFRTFDQISYAYVLEADTPLKVGDELRPPVATE